MKDEKLRLNLQFFSDEEETDEIEDDETEDVEDKEKDSEKDTTEDGDKSFTQEDVDRIVEARLARERKKLKEAEEKEKKKEQGKYKELYEETQTQLKEIKRKSLLTTAMMREGYSEDQIERYSKYVEGEEEEEIEESIKELVDDIVPEGAKETKESAEPGAYPPNKKEAKTKDGTDYGRQAYERIKNRK